MRVLLEPAHAASRRAAALAAAGQADGARRGTCLVAVHESTAMAARHLRRGIAAAATRRGGRNSRSKRQLARDRSRSRRRAAARFRQYLRSGPASAGVRRRAGRAAGGDCGAHPGVARVVVDHRPAYADARRFPGARVVRADARTLGTVIDLAACHAVVVMSHHSGLRRGLLARAERCRPARLCGTARAGGAAPTDRAGIGLRLPRASSRACAVPSASISAR